MINQQFLLNLGDYSFDLKKQIGQGQFGNVYYGFQTSNPLIKVAVKVFKKSVLQINGKDFEQFKREYQIAKKFQGKGVVLTFEMGIIQYGQKNKKIGIVQQLMDGNLNDFLLKKGILTQRTAIKLIKKVIQCYQSLYNSNILHRDLKPGNILYKIQQNKLVFKLGDFGLAKFDHHGEKTQQVGTFGYIAPQYLKQNYNYKVDIYAIGCIFFEFLNGAGQTPVQQNVVNYRTLKTNQDKLSQVLNQRKISYQTFKFIKDCLKTNPQQRLSFQEIKNHQIFKPQFIKYQLPKNNNPQNNSISNQYNNKTIIDKLFLIEKQSNCIAFLFFNFFAFIIIFFIQFFMVIFIIPCYMIDLSIVILVQIPIQILVFILNLTCCNLKFNLMINSMYLSKTLLLMDTQICIFDRQRRKKSIPLVYWVENILFVLLLIIQILLLLFEFLSIVLMILSINQACCKYHSITKYQRFWNSDIYENQEINLEKIMKLSLIKPNFNPDF